MAELCIKFIYSEKATKFCEISTLLLSYLVPVKSKVEILQNFVAFSVYMNLKKYQLLASVGVYQHLRFPPLKGGKSKFWEESRALQSAAFAWKPRSHNISRGNYFPPGVITFSVLHHIRWNDFWRSILSLIFLWFNEVFFPSFIEFCIIFYKYIV